MVVVAEQGRDGCREMREEEKNKALKAVPGKHGHGFRSSV